MPPTPTQLSLLADHLKLLILEQSRQSAPTAAQTKEIKRNLESLRSGLEQLESQPSPPDTTSLRNQYTSLLADFTSVPSPALATQAEAETSAQTEETPRPNLPRGKSVRFRDEPHDAVDEAARAQLFNRYSDAPGKSTPASAPYTDDPSGVESGYTDVPPEPALDNQQMYDQHNRTLAEQDEHLDNLGASVRRQRMLGISIGNELDEQNGILDDLERGVDRFQGTLDRGRERLGNFARKNKGGISWMIIAILVLILIILIAI